MTEEQAAAAVARALYPAAEWQDDYLALVQCPGIDLHTGSNGRKDCRITINDGRPPTLFCVHQSCADVVAAENKRLRSAIGKLKTSAPTGNHIRNGRGVAPKPASVAVARKPASTAAPEPAAKLPLTPEPLPPPRPNGQALHLETCFATDELVAIVYGNGPHGKPLDAGQTQRREPLTDEHSNGTFIRVNPMRQNGRGDADVAAWRHCLIECDSAALELQWAAIRASQLPVSVVVHSGGRSVHAWVRVDASTAEEFRERAAKAADAMEAFEGIKVDRSTLNPSRLARLAGRRRGDATQHLLAINIGATCWDDWLAGRKTPEPPAEEPQQQEPESRGGVQFYYRKNQKDYLLVRDGNSNVIPLNEAGLKAALRFEGMVEPGDKEAVERMAYDIKLETGIDYDGPMPGYARGLHVENGQRCFVTTQAEPVVGLTVDGSVDQDIGHDWPHIHELFRGLLAPPGAKPLAMEHLWWSLKLSRESLSQALESRDNRNVRPGPVTVFCGPKNCGKTLLVNHVITPLLGGRCVDAHKAFTSDAEGFNGELLAGEVWLVDDKIHSCDLKSRRQFAANIKSKLYAGRVGFHAKFKEQVTITPWARLFVCCNDQDEAIRVLPVLTDDLADKMHLFRCYAPPEGLPTQTADDWTAYGAALRAELPAFAGFIDAVKIPPRFRAARNGMRCWQDPHIVSLLADQTPEHQLAQLLAHLFETDQLGAQYNRTAQELLEHLTNIEPIRWQLGNLLHHDPALLGRYLGRLVGEAERLAALGVTLRRTGKRREAYIYDLLPCTA